MSVPLPTIGANEALETAMTAFASADAALVLVDGKPAGVVSRSDVLAFLGS
jgi:cystathionine beta-synthase